MAIRSIAPCQTIEGAGEGVEGLTVTTFNSVEMGGCGDMKRQYIPPSHMRYREPYVCIKTWKMTVVIVEPFRAEAGRVMLERSPER